MKLCILLFLLLFGCTNRNEAWTELRLSEDDLIVKLNLAKRLFRIPKVKYKEKHNIDHEIGRINYVQIHNGTAYVLTPDKFIRLDLANWRAKSLKIPYNKYRKFALVKDRIVLFGENNAKVIYGKVKVDLKFNSIVYDVVAGNNSIVFITSNGTCISYDLLGETKLWTYEMVNSNMYSVQGAILLDGELAILQDGQIYIIDIDTGLIKDCINVKEASAETGTIIKTENGFIANADDVILIGNTIDSSYTKYRIPRLIKLHDLQGKIGIQVGHDLLISDINYLKRKKYFGKISIGARIKSIIGGKDLITIVYTDGTIKSYNSQGKFVHRDIGSNAIEYDNNLLVIHKDKVRVHRIHV